MKKLLDILVSICLIISIIFVVLRKYDQAILVGILGIYNYLSLIREERR
jgi:hypothetical protein